MKACTGEPMLWTFISIEDEKETPPEVLDARDQMVATWLTRIFLAEQGSEESKAG